MSRPNLKPLLIVALLVVGGVVATVWTTQVSSSSEAGIELNLPETVGPWRGPKIEPSDLEVKLLPKGTEFFKRSYTNDAGDSIYCSIVLSSPDPRSIHRPELCLPTQGVKVVGGKEIRIPIEGLSKPLPVMQLNTVLRPPGRPDAQIRGYFNYWFVGKDRITAQHYQRILWNMYDRVIHSTNHRWAYIIVQATVPESYLGKGMNDEQTRAMVTAFIQEIFPTINRTKSLRE